MAVSTYPLLYLNGLKPTQPAVGKDQVFYKVGRYDGVNWPDSVQPSLNGNLEPGKYYSDDQKMFEDVSETNGSGSKNVDRGNPATSRPGDPATFTTAEEIGSNPSDMKTVILGPDGNYYLTDGHHTTNEFTTMQRGGIDDFELAFVENFIVEDFSGIEDINADDSVMDEFWKKMANTGNAWLKILNQSDYGYDYMAGVEGSATEYKIISVDFDKLKIPDQLGIDQFADDPYRAMMYFTRDIGWSKPVDTQAEGIPFLEFYWAEEIQSALKDGSALIGGWDLDLHTNNSQYDLTDLQSYLDAIKSTSKWLISLDPDELIGTSGYTASEMGKLQEFNSDNYNILIDASDPKGKGEATKFLKTKNSDDSDASKIGNLPKLGKLGYSWAHKSGLESTKKINFIQGTDAKDNIVGSSSDDEIFGFGSADTLKGLQGKDVIRGGKGRDRIKGGSGHDIVFGGLGNDHLSGGGGDDVLNGGKGENKMSGGKGKDTFKIKFHKGKPDTVKDFTVGDDKIEFIGRLQSVSIQSSGDDAHIFNGSDLMAVVYGASGQLQVSVTGNFIV